jgi:hypothetical protein
MGLVSGRIGASNNTSNVTNTAKKKLAYVFDIILDEENEYSKNRETFSTTNGAIRFKTADNTQTAENLPIAYPADKVYKSLPIRNELVEVYELTQGYYVYRRMGTGINPTKTAIEDSISSTFIAEESNTAGSYKTYQKTLSTGTTKVSKNEYILYDGYGDYYTPQDNIHNLKLYEGDVLVESRFGQSIRFSAFNNPNNSFSPTTIIRNGESAVSRQIAENVSIEEDINRDGSTIAMTSEEYELGFKPGTVDDKGKSDFETKPDSFADFPSKLIGDNILINSGRIILSAKNAEMIFFSKKNYGFISDGGLSIDNKLGVDISVGDNINMITNDNDIVMYTGNGSIFLGNKQLEPLVKGQQLVDILSQLIDAITNQMYLTPAGPSSVGPVNLADFGVIKSKLNDILSKVNQTS